MSITPDGEDFLAVCNRGVVSFVWPCFGFERHFCARLTSWKLPETSEAQGLVMMDPGSRWEARSVYVHDDRTGLLYGRMRDTVFGFETKRSLPRRTMAAENDTGLSGPAPFALGGTDKYSK